MARSLLVAPAADHVGLARTCLGLLRALDRAGVEIAFVKPVAQPRPDGGPDRSAALVEAVTTLRPQDPLATADLEGQLGQDRVGKARLDVVLEKIVAAWEPIYAGSDVVVVEGLSSGPSKLYVSAVNQALARSLDAEVLLVGQWPPDDAVEPLAGQLAIAAGGYASGEQGRVVGCVVHGLPPAEPGAIEQLTAELARRGLRLIAGVPYRPELTWPRVRDLVRELDPEILSEGDLTRRIRGVAVFAQGVPGGMRALDDGRLIVVPGDRHEVIMAAYLTELSGTHLAALLLSAGIPPDPQVRQLTRATSAAGLPVLLVEQDSYQTAVRVRDLDPGLPADDLDRIEGVTSTIADALDPFWLDSLTSTSRPGRLSPAAFRYQLVERARAAGARLVLPEGTEPRTMQAAVACAERGIARSVLLGHPGEVAGTARGQAARQPGGRAGQRLHLPRPRYRQHHLQGRAAQRAGGQHGPDAAGPGQACERPQPRRPGRGHHLYDGADRHPGPGRLAGRPQPDPPGPPVRPAPIPAYLLLVVRYRILVSGRVQGVFFRDTCRRLALEHGVAGWVRNLPDGRVEAVFEGLADDVARLIEWTRNGPRLAVVDEVAVQPEQPEGLAAFDIR